MSVFTPVTPEQLAAWLRRYSVGSLEDLQGIAEGVENTNYFVTTSRGRYVLTLFEKLTREELPFYVHLMAHLARHGIPCPAPIADQDNDFLGSLNGKPAILVTRLPGRWLQKPTPEQCAAVGAILADMHLAGQSYGRRLDNPRGPRWRREAAAQVAPFLDPEAAALLKEEMRFQSLFRLDDLPRGVIHADLFRDNVLFEQEHIGGLIDFYFAGNDTLLFDLAVACNDWCVEGSGELDEERTHSLLHGYHAVRQLTALERGGWPVMLRAAALRFWLSRLLDRHMPRPGEIVLVKDPDWFREILRLRAVRGSNLPWLD
jgi:homoserine kinase type II